MYLKGPLTPFRTASERRAFVGKSIRYLRDCDIDKSGRGYFFPRVGRVVAAVGTQMILENGSSLTKSELREVEILDDVATAATGENAKP